MSAMQRRKGAAWERAVANTLKAIWPDARRGLDQPQDGGHEPDITGTPYWLEAKAHRLVNIPAAIRQALEASDGRPPVAVTKSDRAPPLATMLLADWFDAMAELVSLRGQAAHLAAATDEVMAQRDRAARPEAEEHPRLEAEGVPHG